MGDLYFLIFLVTLGGPGGPYGALWGPMVTKNLKKSKSPKIAPNQVLMVRFDAESPQEFESDPGEARGGHLRQNKAKVDFRFFSFPKKHFEATIR